MTPLTHRVELTIHKPKGYLHKEMPRDLEVVTKGHLEKLASDAATTRSKPDQGLSLVTWFVRDRGFFVVP